MVPKGSKYHYSRSLVGVWAPNVYTRLVLGPFWGLLSKLGFRILRWFGARVAGRLKPPKSAKSVVALSETIRIIQLRVSAPADHQIEIVVPTIAYVFQGLQVAQLMLSSIFWDLYNPHL